MQEPHAAQCLIVLACAATLWRLARTLPWQSVIACYGLIAGLSALLEVIGAKTGFPFGRFIYTDNFGPLWLHQIPWPIPLLWVVILLNARGVARQVLRPFGDRTNYGLLVLGLAALFAVIFNAGLEPIASRANHWWVWNSAKTVSSWYGAPWINFAGRGVTAFLMLACATPWLLDKKVVTKSPPDFFQLVVWLMLNLLLVIGDVLYSFWAAAILLGLANLLIVFFALRNARVARAI